MKNKNGPVAHLVERLICTEEAGGSSPLGSTKRNIVGIKKMERERMIWFRASHHARDAWSVGVLLKESSDMDNTKKVN